MNKTVLLFLYAILSFGCYRAHCPDEQERSRKTIQPDQMNSFVFNTIDTLRFTFNMQDTVTFVSQGSNTRFEEDCDDFNPDCGCIRATEIENFSKEYVSPIYRDAFFCSIAAVYSDRIDFGIRTQYEVSLYNLAKATDTMMVNGFVYQKVIKTPTYAYNAENGVLFLMNGNDKWERLK